MDENKKSVRVLPWLFIILLYINCLYPVVTSLLDTAAKSGELDKSNSNFRYWVILILITSLIGIINCIMAFVNCRKNREDYLCGCVAALKYATIPFYIVYFLFAVTFGMMFLLFPGGIFLDLLLIWICFCVFCVSICYAWSYLIATVRNKKRTAGNAVWHGILMAIYVIDIVDTIYLMIKQKKYVAVSVITAVFMFIATIVTVGLLIFAVN